VSKGEDTRHAILERAFRLASRCGLEGLTIGSLSEELGMSKSGLFAHFKSKEALQLAVVDHAADRFVARVIDPTQKVARGEPRLRAFFDHWLDWYRTDARDGGCFFAAAGFEVDDRPGPVRSRIAELQRNLHVYEATLVRKAVDEGHFRADVDPDQIAFALHGITLGLQHQDRLLGDRRAEALARATFEALIASARPPAVDRVLRRRHA
jgi:AcrR family transcriptional regulator